MADLIYFSDAKLALAKEVREHPPLVKLTAEYDREDFGMILGEIAAYCEVMLDGEYTVPEIDKLCDILVTKLRAKRAGIIVNSPIY